MPSLYTLTGFANIKRSDGVFIPEDIDNIDWQEYQIWLAEGNTPEPYIAPVIIPQEVTRFQALAALHNAGLLDAVQASMSNADTLTQLAWQNAVTFKRQSPMILNMAAALNISDTQLDGLFTAASTIE